MFETAGERDRARIYRLVTTGQAQSRSDIAKILQLRSTTVSRAVSELVARRLLVESSTVGLGRGRPAAVLIANPRAIGAAVIHVVSQSMVGAIVDLNGEIIHRRSVTVPSESGNAEITSALRSLSSDLIAAMPHGMANAGLSMSLSGLIDLQHNQWLVSSRWPSMRNLNVETILAPIVGKVRICRNLDAELRARVASEPEGFSGGTLLVHWGWGIGLSYAVDGEPLSPAGGSFGEIGHWRFSVLEGRRCGCGNQACLETGAALWSLIIPLRERWSHLTEDEEVLSETLAQADILSLPEVRDAAFILARALANACRLLFPRRILISGPFVRNNRLFSYFDNLFREEGGIAGYASPKITAVRASHDREIQGAASILLSDAAYAAIANVKI